MEPWEVMISESQERMIAIVRPQMLEAVEAVLDRWELEHAVIGEVTATGELRAFWDGEVVGEIPARLLTDECPRYEVAQAQRAPTSGARDRGRAVCRATRWSSCSARLRFAAASSCFAATTSSSDRGRSDGRASTPPCSGCGRRCAGSRSRSTARAGSRDSIPFTGGALAVLEAARNVACVGGEPIGFTDCLNFGNPEKPEIGWELARGDRRHRGGLRGARGAGRVRATSRSTTRRTVARSIRRRSSARSVSSRTSAACRRAGATAT